MTHVASGAPQFPVAQSNSLTAEERKVIVASSLGTVFEWYDFILFGSLAGIIGQQFFSKADPATGFIFALLAFSAGFIVRPIGALVFGRVGDRIGRKYTFLATIMIMGLATFVVGILPNYDAIGITAPIILIGLRLLQGLAVGGEYGGAVVYVAEHAPAKKRGAFTSWIQTTGTIGFLISLSVVLVTRLSLGEPAFVAWGWRIPFLLSIVLLGISVWIRLSLEESPVFVKMKSEGKLSKAPLSEAFGRWTNIKIALSALFGLVAGFGVVWYTAQFYTLLFLTQTLKVDGPTANIMVLIALLAATPFFVFFGTLSDRIGRKKIVLTGILLAGLAFFPTFKAITHYANPALEKALADAPVVLVADPADCHFQFNLTGTSKFLSSCDIAKAKLVASSVNYSSEVAPTGSVAAIRVGSQTITSYDGTGLDKEAFGAKEKAFVGGITTAIKSAGYPTAADPAQVNKPMVTLLVFALVFLLAMAYGPVAALLVELFPTRIRYSGLSLPYHIGTGWFGGLTPTIAFAMVAYQGDIYYGLWFPVIVSLVTAAIGFVVIRETKDVDITS